MSIKIAPFLPELLRALFQKPATVKYPFEKTPVFKDFRGNVVFDPLKCSGCMVCIKDCPAEAIEIIRVSETEKKFKMILYNDRCIHCAQCVDSCPTKAYTMNEEFELAVLDRHQLKIVYNYPPSSPPTDPSPLGSETSHP